jgi:hypothetical protein
MEAALLHPEKRIAPRRIAGTVRKETFALLGCGEVFSIQLCGMTKRTTQTLSANC